MTFVGFTTATQAELGDLIRHPAIALPSSYYFLRWCDRVSGIQMALPDSFPSPEGQLFNATLELRWKQLGSNYEILILSQTEPNLEFDFSALEGDWEWSDRNAYFYDNDETKFPKGFLYQDAAGQWLNPKDIPVKQRYFQDARTSTVHFVALTVDKKHG